MHTTVKSKKNKKRTKTKSVVTTLKGQHKLIIRKKKVGKPTKTKIRNISKKKATRKMSKVYGKSPHKNRRKIMKKRK